MSGQREAGRELDAEIAERVVALPSERWPYRCRVERHTLDERIWCYDCSMMVDEGERVPPPYSTDIASAWAVVEKMGELGFHARITTPFIPGNACFAGFTPHGVTGWNGAPDHVGYATTVPHAICLAALQAVADPSARRALQRGDQ